MNPLLQESTLPYNLPPFAAIRDEHFAPAFDQGMAEHRAEVEAIVNSSDAPTFANTIEALERAGALLSRTNRIFHIYTAGLTNPALQNLEGEISPRLSAHYDSVYLHPLLFPRIDVVYQQRDALGLDAESRFLVERYHEDFLRRGAQLAPADQEKLKSINAELASLHTRFRQNLLKEIDANVLQIGDRSVRLRNTTDQPVLAELDDAAERQRVMAASLARNAQGGDFDNRGVLRDIVRLRAELARLIGFPNYAAYNLKVQTAGTIEAVNKLLSTIAPPAVANARKEAAELEAIAGGPITAADWTYYGEKVRRAQYAFDESELKPYFEVRRVLIDGVFYAATRLFGITFQERTDLAGYSPDMMTFEVFDVDGTPLGLLLADFYARPNKVGGAWANAYVPQARLTGHKPVTAIHLNVVKPAEGEPTLLSYDEVETTFHEFGHAIHQLFSDVQYPFFSGTRVPRDFVEFPSQIYEMWATWPEVIERYAVHYKTGEPMPQELLAKAQAAGSFHQGYLTTELVAAAILDQAWHQLGSDEIPDDVEVFEADVLRRHAVDFPLIPPRYRSAYFSHIFSSAGYAAGYYSYLWAEVLDADGVAWFTENGGLTRANGDHLRNTVLSKGGSQEAMTQYRNFRGADPAIEPMLRRRRLCQN